MQKRINFTTNKKLTRIGHVTLNVFDHSGVLVEGKRDVWFWPSDQQANNNNSNNDDEDADSDASNAQFLMNTEITRM